MSKSRVSCGVVVVLAIAGTEQMSRAQAPTTAQRWETRFKIERFADDGVTVLSSTFSTDPINYDTSVSVGRVDITYQGRVAILASTAASGTSNLGVSRLGGTGGATSGFRMQFVDQVSRDAGLNQGTLSQAVTSGTAVGGVPNTGLFPTFRGVLTGWSAAVNASNTDPNNGRFFNNTTSDTASPVLANVVAGRTQNFGAPGAVSDNHNGTGGPVGVATVNGADLLGEFADYYKFSYTARVEVARIIHVNVFGASGRYIYSYAGNGNASNGGNNNFVDGGFDFAVASSTAPAPGGAVMLGFAGVLAARRRRRGG